jgi:threonine dehydratase
MAVHAERQGAGAPDLREGSFGLVQIQQSQPTFVDVFQAQRRVMDRIVRTPIRRSDALSRRLGRDVWIKPECLQRTGSFKFRGSLNRVLLHREASNTPVITVSSGNQAIGVATAGQLAGVETTVVVPTSVSPAKLGALRSLGAHVELAGEGFDEAEAAMYRIAREAGAEVVSSFDADVIAGHATVAWEMLEDVPDLSVILAPVGSGGLLAGTALVARNVSAACSALGVQTANAPVMHTCLARRELMSVHEHSTIADGLAGNVLGSTLPFQIIVDSVPEILLVQEESIYTGIGFLARQERLIAEGAGAATAAALLEGQVLPGDGPVGLILSGGNIASERFNEALKRYEISRD